MSQVVEAPCSLLERHVLGRMTLKLASQDINTKFEIGQTLMVIKHACHTFEPNYGLQSTENNQWQHTTTNGREHKTNINDVKPVSTIKLTESACDSFLNSINLTIRIMIIT